MGAYGCLGGGLLGFSVAGWGQVRRGLARRQEARTRHHDLCQQRQVSAAWVSWQGQRRSRLHRARQSARRRGNFAGVTGRREGVRESTA
jgi:hypothetical protein